MQRYNIVRLNNRHEYRETSMANHKIQNNMHHGWKNILLFIFNICDLFSSNCGLFSSNCGRTLSLFTEYLMFVLVKQFLCNYSLYCLWNQFQCVIALTISNSVRSNGINYNNNIMKIKLLEL